MVRNNKLQQERESERMSLLRINKWSRSLFWTSSTTRKANKNVGTTESVASVLSPASREGGNSIVRDCLPDNDL